MADFQTRTETTTRKIYSLPNPTNLAEVYKLINSIITDGHLPGTHDNAVTVEADEEEIIFWFEVEND